MTEIGGAERRPDSRAAGPEVLDRGISEAVRARRGRSPWPLALGGLLLGAALVAIHAPRSETREAGHEPEARHARGPAPRLDAFPDAKAAQASEPALTEPQAAPPSPIAQEVVLNLQRQALQEAEANRRRAGERQRSPIVIFDQASRPREAGSAARGAGAQASQGTEERLGLLAPRAGSGTGEPGREERFAEQAALEPVETVRAERIEHPSTLVPQGTFIQGVLETELQSDLPGMIRAQVSAPVRAFDGSLVIPRGSRLIGRYQSGLVRGQTRLFVIWTRLLRPDGVSIRIDSPGTDILGRAGVSGDVDTHFFEIFGSSVLLSLLDGGLDVAKARAQSGNSTVIETGGQDLNRAAEIALQNRITVAPTIRVPRGTPIQVVVSKDLDFAGADSRMD